VGARTDAARAEVLAARGALIDEVQGLEASARAAADIPAKVRRNPVRTVGAAGGAAFLLLGGPQRIYRRARRAVMGPKADLPKTILPKEVDRTLRGLGDDGDRVRAVVEKEFAKYLRERTKLVTDSDAKAAAVSILALALRPVASQVGKQLAKQVIAPDREGIDAAIGRIRGARSGGTGGDAAGGRPGSAPAVAPKTAPGPKPGPAPAPTSAQTRPPAARS
jgi:hypothetical protein